MAVTAARQPRIYYGYWILAGAFVAQLIAIGTQTSVSGVFLKPMTEELGWTRAEYTYGQTVSRFVMSFVGFFLGVYVDRYGGRRFMLAGATVMGLSLFATAYVQELWQWAVLRGVTFTMGAAMIGNLVVNVTMSKWWVRRRGQMIGFSSMGVSMAGILFPPLVTGVVEEWGWRVAWQVLAVMTCLCIYPVALLMRRQPEDYGLYPDGLSEEQLARGDGAQAAADYANSFTRGEALRTPALYLIVLAFGLGGVGIGVVLLQTIPFLTDTGFSPQFAALMSTTMSVPALFSKPFWGWLQDIIQPNRAAALGFVQSGIALVVIVVAAHEEMRPLLVVGFLMMGWGFGGQIPLQETIWATYFGRRHLGSVRSVAMPFSLVIGAGAPLAVSAYFDIVGDYNGAFFVVSGLWILAAVVVMLVRRPLKEQPATAARAA